MQAHDDLADVGIALGGVAQVGGDGDAALLVHRLERKSLEELPVRHANTPMGTAFPSPESAPRPGPALKMTVER
ncbi:hypothetical protein, partial [Escherichia coli]|uniref:hypothetical protein n=1 Tax=Escherichia coli TaxID=562 RepID=UPI003C7548EC